MPVRFLLESHPQREDLILPERTPNKGDPDRQAPRKATRERDRGQSRKVPRCD